MKLIRAFLYSLSRFSALSFKVREGSFSYGAAAASIPFVGLIICGVSLLWFRLCGYFGFGSFVISAGIFTLPFAITGFLHALGFTSTVNLLNVIPSGEKSPPFAAKLRPASVLISLTVGILYFWSFTSHIWSRSDIICFGIFNVLSRAFIALGSYLLPSVSGTVFNKASKEVFSKKAASCVCMIWVAVSLCALYAFGPWVCAAGAFGGAAAFAICYILIKKKFYGFSYDLCGFYIVVAEILMTFLYFAAKRIII